jgi:SNF2 family DNA or RNA helicase
MLAMPMSSGKTRVAIDWLQINDYRTCLILCPKHVIDVWPQQLAKYLEYPQDFWIMGLDNGTVAYKKKVAEDYLQYARETKKTAVIVINYQSAIFEPFRSWAINQWWDLVISDESHRIKSPSGKWSFFAKRLHDRSRSRICLTGTPMPHSPLDIYAQYRFLDPRVYGSRVDEFKLRYCHIGGFSGRQIIGWHNLDDLRSRFQSLAFESSEAELDLPKEQDILHHCDLEPKARKHYQELKKEFITWTKQGAVTASNSMVKLLRFQQITAGFFQHRAHPKAPKIIEEISTAKSELLEQILLDLPPTEPVVIICLFHPEMDKVHDVCRRLKLRSLELSGRKRGNGLAAWQAGKAPILVKQSASGSEGIDLTRAHYGIFYSLGYNRGDYDQNRRRINRTTQTHPVTFIHLLCRDTVDQLVRRAIENGKDIVSQVTQELTA